MAPIGKIGFGCIFVLCFVVLAVSGRSVFSGPVSGPVDGPVRLKRSNDDFSWHDCGSNPNRPFKISYLSMSPSPVTLPGELRISLRGEITRRLDMADMQLRIKKEAGYGWFKKNFTVPCLFNIGSCDYSNICTLVHRMEHEDWLGISGNVGRQIREGLKINRTNTCPLEPEQFNMDDEVFQLPTIPSIFHFFARGTFYVTVRFLNSTNHNDVYGCLSMKMSID